MTTERDNVFERHLEQAFASCQYTLAMENRDTASYRALRAQTEALFAQTSDKLGEDRTLLLRLEALYNQMGAQDTSYVYLQGMRDCVTLLKKIGVI